MKQKINFNKNQTIFNFRNSKNDTIDIFSSVDNVCTKVGEYLKTIKEMSYSNYETEVIKRLSKINVNLNEQTHSSLDKKYKTSISHKKVINNEILENKNNLKITILNQDNNASRSNSKKFKSKKNQNFNVRLKKYIKKLDRDGTILTKNNFQDDSNILNYNEEILLKTNSYENNPCEVNFRDNFLKTQFLSEINKINSFEDYLTNPNIILNRNEKSRNIFNRTKNKNLLSGHNNESEFITVSAENPTTASTYNYTTLTTKKLINISNNEITTVREFLKQCDSNEKRGHKLTRKLTNLNLTKGNNNSDKLKKKIDKCINKFSNSYEQKNDEIKSLKDGNKTSKEYPIINLKNRNIKPPINKVKKNGISEISSTITENATNFYKKDYKLNSKLKIISNSVEKDNLKILRVSSRLGTQKLNDTSNLKLVNLSLNMDHLKKNQNKICRLINSANQIRQNIFSH